MASPAFFEMFLAEAVLFAITIVAINLTKKPSKRQTHTEALRKFSTSKTERPKEEEPDTFESHKNRYIKAIKEGRYKTKDLACRDLYDIDEEFYKCLEEVYFH
jgi:hypothetical protein